MNSIDLFRQTIRLHGQYVASNKSAMGTAVVLRALRDGIEILTACIAQVEGNPNAPMLPFAATREETRVHEILSSLKAKPRSKDVTLPPSHGALLGAVDDIVAEAYGIPVALLHHRGSRRAQVIEPQQVAMALAYDMRLGTTTQIARYYGRGDHTAVSYAREQVRKRADSARDIGAMRQLVEGKLRDRLAA